MANPYADTYVETQTATVAPDRLLLLLYEGAIRFLGRAREELGQGRLGPGKTALSKGMAIIAELQNSLDPDAGWTGAADLSHLYGHMTLELTEANLKGDLGRIDRVRDLLSHLYDAWREAIESAPAGSSAVPDSGPPAPFHSDV